MKKCENCDKKFRPKRETAKYCSTSCRVGAARTIEEPKATTAVEISERTMRAIAQQQGIGVDTETGEITESKPYDREANLKAFQKMGLKKVEWLTTGIADFDALTQIPRGRITQIQGPYGVGKTTLCLNMVAGMKDAKVLYIDSEASLNPDLLADLELDAKKFTLYNDSAYFEDIAEVIRSAAKSGVYDAIIFDSLASTTTKTEAEGDITASNIGQKAKLMHKLIHLTQMDFKNNDTAFIVINQERDVIGSYVPQKYTPGGNAVPYAASLIVALKTIKSWRFPKDPKDGLYQGHEVEATIIKSKVNTPWRKAKFPLYYPNPVAIDAVPQPGELVEMEAF